MIAILLAIGISFGLCSFIAAKEGPNPASNIDAPEFSAASGFYDSAFYLTIDAQEGATIYYTLDCSEPDKNSKIYVQPLLVDNATLHENVYSMRMDTSAGFYVDLIDRFQTLDSDPGYKQPDFLVDKCTIVRAIAVSKSGSVSAIATATFFVGVRPEEYDNCNIICISTDPKNLFDQKTGIYVTGDVFEKYLFNGRMNRNWRFWEANYRQRGHEWEREATFHFFDKAGKLVLSKQGGIRTHGGVSRGTLPRSLNLYAREEYDGSEKFGVHLFGNEYDAQRITLASGGNQLITQFNDYMMTERMHGLNFAVTAFEPYVLFLNGEYWGFYWLTEKYDEDYLEYYYNVDPDNVVLVKNNSLEIGNTEDFALYRQMQEYVANNDMSIAKNYEEACRLIDIDSFIDYYATMIYIARSEDWPGGNTALWRTREIRDNQYSDGKWRWLLFDCNSTSMNYDLRVIEHDTLKYVIKKDATFAALWENELFRERFEKRIMQIADECFEPNDMSVFIDNYNDMMLPRLSESWARFYGSDNEKLDEYYKKMNGIMRFFCERKAEVENWFAA